MEKKKPTFYELADNVERLEATIIDLIDEDEAFAETLMEYLDKAEEDMAEKVDRIAFLIEDLALRAKAQKEKARALTEAAKACEDRVVRTKEWMKSYLESKGKDNIRGKVKTIALIGHGGLAPLKWSDGEPEIEAWTLHRPEYTRKIVTYEVDKLKIREDLDAGKVISPFHHTDGTLVVPGVVMGERGKGVRIK